MLPPPDRQEPGALPAATPINKLRRVGYYGSALRREEDIWDVGQATSATLTRKQLREKENIHCPGGMRTPWKYVQSNPRARSVGRRINAAICLFLDRHPSATTWLLDHGEAGWKQLRQTCGQELIDEIAMVLQPNSTARSKMAHWRGSIVSACISQAKNPEVHLPTWMEEGCPTGVARPIPACGVFPSVPETAQAQRDLRESLTRSAHNTNYESTKEHAGKFMEEIERLTELGALNRYDDWAHLRQELGDVIVSKVALLLKQRADGTWKLRVIIDMLRSWVNSPVRLQERLILPRLMDVVSDLLGLARHAVAPQAMLDQMTLDWADAFHSFKVHPDELPFSASHWKTQHLPSSTPATTRLCLVAEAQD